MFNVEVLICVVIFVGVFALVWALGHQIWLGQRRYYAGLKRQREGHTEKEFVDYFSARGVGEDVSSAVYRSLSECNFGVPVLPGDVLKKYFPDWDDLPQLDDLGARAGWGLPVPNHELGEMSQAVTVEDLVMIVDRLRREKCPEPAPPGS